MPRPSEVSLKEEVWVPEVRERDATSRLECRREFGRTVDPCHPDPAATGRRLEEHRIPEFRRDGARLVDGPDRSIHAAGNRNPFLGHRLPRGDLVAGKSHRTGRRADEDESGLRASCCKDRIFREEPVAGMNRVDVCFFCRAEDVVDAQVAVDWERPSDQDRLVHRCAVERAPIRVRINPDAADPHLPGGPSDPNRDLPSIRDQEPAKHWVPITAGCFRASSPGASPASFEARQTR